MTDWTLPSAGSGNAHSELVDLDRALVAVLAPAALLEQVGLRRAEGTHRQCDAAMQLVEWFGRTREPDAIVALLSLLPAGQAGCGDRTVLVQEAALGRPPAEAARIAQLLAEAGPDGTGRGDADRMCVLVASFRSAREIAQFVCVLAGTSQASLAQEVVQRVAEHRTMETVARLELALRALGRAELASRMVTTALGRRGQAAEIAELIDSQLAFGPRMADDGAIGEPVATHIREHMPEAVLIDLVLREHRRDPGRTLAWCAGVAESAGRPIATVVELLAKVSAHQHTNLAEKITATVACHRGAEDLIAYTVGCKRLGHDVFDPLFRRVSMEASPETVSNLLQLWHAQHSGKNTRLLDVLAAHAPSHTLTGAATHLAARSWHGLADDLLRAALEHPERFEAVEVGTLLARISRAGASIRPTRRGDAARAVMRKLEAAFSADAGTGVNVAYLAGLACTVADEMAEPARAADVRGQIGCIVFNRSEPGLCERYYDALRILDRNDLAEEFHRATRMILLPNSARRRS